MMFCSNSNCMITICVIIVPEKYTSQDRSCSCPSMIIFHHTEKTSNVSLTSDRPDVPAKKKCALIVMPSFSLVRFHLIYSYIDWRIRIPAVDPWFKKRNTTLLYRFSTIVMQVFVHINHDSPKSKFGASKIACFWPHYLQWRGPSG